MEKVVRVFHSFEEADAADVAEDRAMTPEERVAVVFELQARLYPDAAQQGFARIYRLTQRTELNIWLSEALPSPGTATPDSPPTSTFLSGLIRQMESCWSRL